MEQDSGKLFIGGISWETNEDRLTEYFGRFGDVAEAVIMRDRITGRARGFGFIVFADPAVAERVTMEKHMIDGRMVEAKKAVPRDDQSIASKTNVSGLGSPGPGRTRKIFVGGLPSTITESDFKSYFEQFGSISDTVVMYDHNTQRPRGFGFITYESEESVDKVLLKSTFHQLNGKMVEVKRAVPKELSPGVSHVRSPVGSNSNYPLTRVNSFLNGYGQTYGSNPLGSYGMRVDGRFGLLSAGRNGFGSFDPGYGMGMGIDQGINPGFVGSSILNSNPSYGRQMSPYYSGNGSRYGSPSPNPNPNPVGYTGIESDITRSSFSSVMARNLWGNGTNYTSPNSFVPSGIGNLGSFDNNNGNNNNINSNINWGGPSRISGQVMGENTSFGLTGTGYGRNSVTGTGTTVNSNSFDNGFEGKNNLEGYSGNSIYGDRTWRFTSTELDPSGPFSYMGHETDTNRGSTS